MAKESTDETPNLEPGRGRHAQHPLQIPLRGWKDIALRVWKQLDEDTVSLISASVAFFSMLAIIPTLIALVTLYGLIADPADVEGQIASLSELLPSEARVLLAEQMRAIVSRPATQLGFGLVISMGGALWASSGATFALIQALNIAYGEEEKRGYLKLRGIAIVCTLFIVLFAGLLVFAVGVIPAIFSVVGLDEEIATILRVGRWPFIAVLTALAMSTVYRYAPCRTRAKWRWVSIGGSVATVVWLVSTALFSVYVTNFGEYNETYGALGGVIVLMLWLYLTAYATLLGAEIDAEIEHQTAEDSTVGEPAPMGERGAEMADTLGETASD